MGLRKPDCHQPITPSHSLRLPPPPNIRRIVSHIASHQNGLVTAADLSHHGLSTDVAYRRVKSGEWLRVTHGVYRVVAAGDSATLQQRMRAANLAIPGSVIIGWFAAELHGLPVLVDLASLEVSLGIDGTRRSSAMRVRRCSGRLPSNSWDGGQVATPLLTIVTLAALGASPYQVETILDAALTRRLVTVDRIFEFVRQRGWLRFRGRAHLIKLLNERSGGKALFRSQTEAKVKRWLRRAGLGDGLPNYLVGTAIGDIEADVAWPACRVILEISPFWTHGSRRTQQRDVDRRQALVAAGWRIVEADDRHLASAQSFRPIIELLKCLTSTGFAN